MNEVKISGSLLTDSKYVEQGSTEAASASLNLLGGGVVTVVAVGKPANDFAANFRRGDAVRVYGRLTVNPQGQVEILGDEFLSWRPGGKQPFMTTGNKTQHPSIRNFHLFKGQPVR